MEEITVKDSRLSRNVLRTDVATSKKLRKYFKSLTFFAEYDAPINVDASILNIPLLAAVLPIAWLTGCDIYVKELDKTFKNSMDKLQIEYSKMYPEIPFTTKINVDNLTENYIGDIDPKKRTGLLFSGGVDSTYTLINNFRLKPSLIMLWGVDNYPYPENSDVWNKFISTYSTFAREKDLEFHVVKTNITSILHYKRIQHNFHEMLYDGSLRARLQHSLVLLPLAAPLSSGRFDRLLISASQDPTYSFIERPWGGTPSADEKIIWADLTVRHDGFIHRTKKITGSIIEYGKNEKITLQVCVRPKINCCSCEKCYRTITTLVLAGLDPRNFGFNIDSGIFERIKKFFMKEKMSYSGTNYRWTPIQELIPEAIDTDICGSKEFLEWFKRFDLKSTEKNFQKTRNIYYKMPFNIANLLDKVYRLFSINIHEASPTRTRT